MRGYGLADRVALDLLGGVRLGRVARLQTDKFGRVTLTIVWDDGASPWRLPATCAHLHALDDGAAELIRPRQSRVRGD